MAGARVAWGMRFIDRQAMREKRLLARELRQRATPEEQLLWQYVRTNKMLKKHFRRQHVLAGFIVDFYCPSAKLVIELDGLQHLDQKEADQQRDAVLSGMGNTVLQFRNPEVRSSLRGVLQRIEAELEKRTIRAVPPSPAVPLSIHGEGTGVRCAPEPRGRRAPISTFRPVGAP